MTTSSYYENKNFTILTASVKMQLRKFAEESFNWFYSGTCTLKIMVHFLDVNMVKNNLDCKDCKVIWNLYQDDKFAILLFGLAIALKFL